LTQALLSEREGRQQVAGLQATQPKAVGDVEKVLKKPSRKRRKSKLFEKLNYPQQLKEVSFKPFFMFDKNITIQNFISGRGWCKFSIRTSSESRGLNTLQDALLRNMRSFHFKAYGSPPH
jgi:hypothetical protein